MYTKNDITELTKLLTKLRGLVRERTIPTERPQVGEVSANFCG